MTDWVKRHPLHVKARWLNCSNCSPDNMYWSLLNIWYVNSPSFFHRWCTVLELDGARETLKARPLPVCGQRERGVPWGQPAHSCMWSDVTLRRNHPHTVPACRSSPGNQLWQPWPSNLIGPWVPLTPASEMVLYSTTMTHRPLDYCVKAFLGFWLSPSSFYLEWIAVITFLLPFSVV